MSLKIDITALRSPRIHLADLSEADLEPLRDWFLANIPERMSSWPIGDQSIDAVRERFSARSGKSKLRALTIRLNDGDQLLGRMTYFNINPRGRWIEFGIMLGPEFHGKGYASESVDLLLYWLFTYESYNKVIAETGEFNKQTIGLLDSFRFHLDGVFRAHHELDGTLHPQFHYSLLSSEYKRKYEITPEFEK